MNGLKNVLTSLKKSEMELKELAEGMYKEMYWIDLSVDDVLKYGKFNGYKDMFMIVDGDKKKVKYYA